jgi:hypothetical protein
VRVDAREEPGEDLFVALAREAREGEVLADAPQRGGSPAWRAACRAWARRASASTDGRWRGSSDMARGP